MAAPGDFIFYAHFKMTDCHGLFIIRKIIYRAIDGWKWLSMASKCQRVQGLEFLLEWYEGPYMHEKHKSQNFSIYQPGTPCK